ncbi:unnamed protein product, partial [Adineta steineri]
MLLVANTSFASLIMGCSTFSMAIFSLHNDLKQLQYQDSLCITRVYLFHSAFCALNFSFFLQALYRYMTVVYQNHRLFQSVGYRSLLICLTWLSGAIGPGIAVLTNEITYTVENQICQIQLHLSAPTIFGTLWNYTLPISMLMLIYFKIVRYVKKMGNNVTTLNTLARAKRELKMIRRIVILVMTLIAVCFPYVVMILMSFFTTPIKYHDRSIERICDENTTYSTECSGSTNDSVIRKQ